MTIFDEMTKITGKKEKEKKRDTYVWAYEQQSHMVLAWRYEHEQCDYIPIYMETNTHASICEIFLNNDIYIFFNYDYMSRYQEEKRNMNISQR